MGHKNAQFMSVQMYRDLFKAADCRAAEWAHSKGLKVYYHSCGDVNLFVPELIEVGVDNIITDKPAYISNVLRAWNDLSDTEKIALWLRNLIVDVDSELVGEL